MLASTLSENTSDVINNVFNLVEKEDITKELNLKKVNQRGNPRTRLISKSSSSFSPVTSTNVGINPQNLLNCSFKPLTTLV